jgi:hypothetical protein
MFERFTDRARRVVVLAEEEARRLDNNYVGPEHILLGIIREDEGIAAKTLKALDISHVQVERGERAPAGHIPFSPHTKKVLELSLREALRLGHGYVGTGHILLGLVREGTQALGVEPNLVHYAVIQQMMTTGKKQIAVYVNAPDCSCGHPQNTHYYPPNGCQQCTTCKEYDGVIETLGVGYDPNHLYPAVYKDGCLILPPELLGDNE